MLMLIMTLRWDVNDVENVIMMLHVVYVHGGADDRKSTSGGCFYLGNNLLNDYR